MFVGYTERVAYGQDEDPAEIDAIDGNVSTHVAVDYDLLKVQPFGGYKSWPDTGDDFIFVGECSETFGPIHLMTIPETCPMKINLNTLAVRILSSDYQGLGVGSQTPNNDTSLMICDAMADVHILVNYFVMFDSQARGFVRPVCLAYVTSDKYKLLKCLKLLKKALCQVTASIKHTNRNVCVQELENLIQDLKYTKNELPAAESVKSKLKLELVENALRDAYNMLENIKHLQIKEGIQETIGRFQDHLKSCDLAVEIKEFLNSAFKSSSHQPRVIKIPLRQNFEKELRPLSLISCGGFLLGLYQLLVIYKFFKRKYENLCFVLKDKINSDECLYFGACIKPSQDEMKMSIGKEMEGNLYCNLHLLDDLPMSFEIEDDHHFQYTKDFVALLPHLTKRQLQVPLSSCAVNSSSNINVALPLSSKCHHETVTSLEASTEKRYSKGVEHRHSKSSTPDRHRHGESLQKIWNMVEVFQAQDKGDLFTKTLQMFSHEKHILYSLLIGNLCVIIGEPQHESQVRAMVHGLSIFVPRSKGRIVLAEEWRSVSVSRHEQSSLAVLGLCGTPKLLSSMVNVTVINLITMSYKGPRYTGILLSEVDKRIKYVTDNGGDAFTVIISILADIELKVRLWQLLSASKHGIYQLKSYLNKKGYSCYDLTIIEKLSNYAENKFK